jgi:hypothetical protein
MKHHASGTHPLARPLLIAAALTIGGATAASLSHYQLGAAEQAERDSYTKLRQSEAALQQTEATLQRTRATLSAWQQLQSGGLSHAPARAVWLEALERLRAAPGLHVGELDFSLEPERPITSPARPEGLAGLRETTLHLTARVAHEGHFLSLLSRVQQIGLNTLQHCSLTRTPGESHDGAPPPSGLLMRCDLIVLHIDMPP